MATVVSIKSSWVVVLSMPGSITKAVAVVGLGVSIVQVSGLWRLWRLWRLWGWGLWSV